MIEIVTMGSFKICVNGEEVSDKHIRTTKLWKLLNLLIINRKKPLQTNVILESIWPEEDTDTSLKSLHNLIYRLRKLLVSEGAAEFVQFKNNSYLLRSGEELVVDVYLMEDYYSEISDISLPLEKKVELLRKAVDLYNGEYVLGSIDNDVGSILAVNMYSRMFVEMAYMLADIYLKTSEYDELISLCNKGILLEPLEERFYEYLVQGMRAKGQTMHAITLCESFFDMLYREYGMSASGALNSLYKEMKGNTIQLQHDVDQALSELAEVEALNRALFCNYEAFKDIYRYESRRAERLKNTIFIILISISDKRDDIPPVKTLGDAMRCLHECCAMELRRGDVVTHYSQTQIIMMLTSENPINIDGIMSRIENRFAARNRGGELKIRFEFKPRPEVEGGSTV